MGEVSKGSLFGRILKRKTPFRSEAHEASIALMVSTSKLKWHLERAVNQEGITSQQFNVLRILRGACGPIATMEVADRMIDHHPGITKLMVRLERRGLIERNRSEEDSRKLMCSITEKGLRVLHQVDDEVVSIEETFFGYLSREKIQCLIEVLEQRHSRESARS